MPVTRWGSNIRGMQSRDAEEAATPSGDPEPDGFLDSLLESSYEQQRPGQVPC